MKKAIEVSDTAKIGKEIAVEVQLGRDDLESAWNHFVRAGEKLNEVRAGFSDRDWSKYLAEHCGHLETKEAQAYMYIARNAERVVGEVLPHQKVLGWEGMKRVVRGLLAQPEVEEKAREVEDAAEKGEITHEQAVELKGKVTAASEALSKGAPVGKTTKEVEQAIEDAKKTKKLAAQQINKAQIEAQKTDDEKELEAARREISETRRLGRAFVDRVSVVRRRYPEYLTKEDAFALAKIATDLQRELVTAHRELSETEVLAHVA